MAEHTRDTGAKQTTLPVAIYCQQDVGVQEDWAKVEKKGDQGPKEPGPINRSVLPCCDS